MGILTAIAFALVPAQAAPANCAPREIIVARLAGKYGETQQSIGVTGDGALVEMWGANGGSWTIIVSLPNGLSCYVTSGEGFQVVPAKGDAT